MMDALCTPITSRDFWLYDASLGIAVPESRTGLSVRDRERYLLEP
jgi:hypothetical protein